MAAWLVRETWSTTVAWFNINFVIRLWSCSILKFSWLSVPGCSLAYGLGMHGWVKVATLTFLYKEHSFCSMRCTWLIKVTLWWARAERTLSEHFWTVFTACSVTQGRKKKPFIDKKHAQTFSLVPRSQKDPLHDDPEEAQYVLKQLQVLTLFNIEICMSQRSCRVYHLLLASYQGLVHTKCDWVCKSDYCTQPK